jgi:hypothetical protein
MDAANTNGLSTISWSRISYRLQKRIGSPSGGPGLAPPSRLLSKRLEQKLVGKKFFPAARQVGCGADFGGIEQRLNVSLGQGYGVGIDGVA